MALDAIKAASNPHQFLSVSKQGLTAIVRTLGNPSCHVILRGGKQVTHTRALARSAVPFTDFSTRVPTTRRRT